MSPSHLLVIKIGGAAGIDPSGLCDDVAELTSEGRSMVLVHGASDRADRLALALGHPARFLISPSGHVSRYTDLQTRDIYVKAVCEVNTELVAALNSRGVQAVGLAGDGSCPLRGERKPAVRAVVDGHTQTIRDDYSGRLTGVECEAIGALLTRGLTPVVPPLAQSERDGLLNVDGDRAAAALAAALRAETLILLSNVPGLLREYPDETSLAHRVPADSLDQALIWAQGRMKRKVISVREALQAGVPRAALADARQPQPLRRALAGGGTWFG